MLLLLALSVVADAHKLLSDSMPDTRKAHSFTRWLDELLLSYPIMVSLFTILVLALLFVLATQCKKRQDSSAEVKTLWVSRAVAETKPLKV